MADIKAHVRQLLLDKLLNKYASVAARDYWSIAPELELISMLLTYDVEITASQKKKIQINFQRMFNDPDCPLGKTLSSYLNFCIDTCPELLNQINEYGITPLMWAIKRRGLEFSKCLIEKGVDQHVVTESGYTAIHYAAEYLPSLLEQLDYTDYLSSEKRVGEGKHLVHLVCSRAHEEYKRLEIIMTLLPLVNIADDFGKTPLVYAAENGQFKLVKQLIDLGAKLDVRINKPGGPMHGVTLVDLLRAKRGDCSFSDKNNLILIDMLIEAGAPNEGLHGRSLLTNASSLSIFNTPKPDEKITIEEEIEKPGADNDVVGWDW